jgi:uncharacterized protein YndB with AHSA1/START domain
VNEVTVSIDAAPERVWALVTDITRMGEWSPENTGGRWRGPVRGAVVGAKFVGANAHGWLRWRTHCTVVEAQRHERFAFSVTENGMTWGWRLEPDGEGTTLTQWRKHGRPMNPLMAAVLSTGVLGKDRERLMVDGMHRTLERVKAAAERASV